MHGAAPLALALALTWAAPGLAGPADRVLRACAPGVGSNPAATLIAEGWLVLGSEYNALVAARLGVLSQASEASNMAIALDDSPAQRQARGEQAMARNAEAGQTTYLTPYDSTTMAQITIMTAPVPQLYCMVSTLANREADEIAARLMALTTRDHVTGVGGVLRAQSQRTPPTDPNTDVSATPLPATWDMIRIDLGLNGDLADADLFLQFFWTAKP